MNSFANDSSFGVFFFLFIYCYDNSNVESKILQHSHGIRGIDCRSLIHVRSISFLRSVGRSCWGFPRLWYFYRIRANLFMLIKIVGNSIYTFFVGNNREYSFRVFVIMNRPENQHLLNIIVTCSASRGNFLSCN